jgi:hypothetical protein
LSWRSPNPCLAFPLICQIEEESFATNVKAESVPVKSVQLQGGFPPLAGEAFQIALKLCDLKYPGSIKVREPGDLRRTSHALLLARIWPGSDHLDQIFEMTRMDKTDDSPGIAAQRLYVNHATGTLADLDALVFVRAQVKLFVTDRTSKSRLFHIGRRLWRSQERPRQPRTVPAVPNL